MRLFLSVDLTNSTAFKSARPPHEWVPIFRDFYSQFYETFKRCHIYVIEKAKEEIADITQNHISSLKDRPPLFWKTVGDEIIFVNRVDSCFEVLLLTKSFAKALKDYGLTLSGETETESLGVKGAGWIASFPYPNIAIEMLRSGSSGGNGIVELESTEASADEDPSKHEFLGKGLDYGFRIARNSENNFFAISPALANVIARANVNDDYAALGTKIRVKPPVKMKGVLNGKDYPVIGIPVDVTEEWSKFHDLQDKLLGSNQSDDRDLRDYFKHFMDLHGIEEPRLAIRPNEDTPDDPKYYTNEYVPKWKIAQKEVEDQDSIISSGAEAPDDDETVGNPNIQTELEDTLEKLRKD